MRRILNLYKSGEGVLFRHNGVYLNTVVSLALFKNTTADNFILINNQPQLVSTSVGYRGSKQITRPAIAAISQFTKF